MTSPSPVELTQPFAVGPDNETSAPKISLPVRRQTRSESRMAGYVISEHPGAADGRRFGTPKAIGTPSLRRGGPGK
jgi:hypothetical protein